ncbi:hypothetical protein PINS_up004452 [Pythium insidiosum]|nr:hypothetical protein PINS_up004452 [Pythium insidiosum]
MRTEDDDQYARLSEEPMTIKRWTIASVVIILTVIGAVIAIVLSMHSSSHAATANVSKKVSNDPQKRSQHDSTKLDGKWRSAPSKAKEVEETDPHNETFTVSALAIGDWGRTIIKEGGSCCQRRKSYTVQDYNAMEYTASLLGLAAAQVQPKPSVVIGHGDNFYWTGLQSANDQAYRFHETFETKYADSSLQGIPWVNVVGNHDYGGASFVCSEGDVPSKCKSTDELLTSLAQKLSAAVRVRQSKRESLAHASAILCPHAWRRPRAGCRHIQHGHE